MIPAEVISTLAVLGGAAGWLGLLGVLLLWWVNAHKGSGPRPPGAA